MNLNLIARSLTALLALFLVQLPVQTVPTALGESTVTEVRQETASPTAPFESWSSVAGQIFSVSTGQPAGNTAEAVEGNDSPVQTESAPESVVESSTPPPDLICITGHNAQASNTCPRPCFDIDANLDLDVCPEPIPPPDPICIQVYPSPCPDPSPLPPECRFNVRPNSCAIPRPEPEPTWCDPRIMAFPDAPGECDPDPCRWPSAYLDRPCVLEPQ